MTLPLAFTFPGQGSQSQGMLADIAIVHPIIEEIFHEASDVVSRDLWQLAQQGPQHDIDATHLTQTLLLTSSVALYRVWQSLGGAQPVVLAGHSLGEYSALVIADVISFADAVTLVHLRGTLMQQATPIGVGAMAAIVGISDDDITAICEQASQGQVVSPANFNCPGQVVIAGNSEAVDRAMLLAQPHARLVKKLAVSVPSHCALMKPAAEKLGERLQEIHIGEPQIPVIHNVDASDRSDPNAIRDALIAQLFSPVRWTQSVEQIAARGITTLIECGPGRVLAGLNKRINSALTTYSIDNRDTLKAALSHQGD